METRLSILVVLGLFFGTILLSMAHGQGGGGQIPDCAELTVTDDYPEHACWQWQYATGDWCNGVQHDHERRREVDHDIYSNGPTFECTAWTNNGCCVLHPVAVLPPCPADTCRQ